MRTLRPVWGAMVFCGALLIIGTDWGDTIMGQPNVPMPKEIISRVDKPLASRSEQTPERTYIGEYTITGYCPCEKCCGKWSGGNTASGTVPTAGRTVGADWSKLSAGTELYIEGLGNRIVEDKPADWIIKKYDGKIIDVFCGTHAEAKKVGKQTVRVYSINR